MSLPYQLLDLDESRRVVDVVGRRLLTSYGLRSLARDELNYQGAYRGGPYERDSRYYQGTIWSWLIGPYAEAHNRAYGDRRAARRLLEPFAQHLRDTGVGTVSETFDGDPPHYPRGCIAQAWSVAEILRVWQLREY